MSKVRFCCLVMCLMRGNSMMGDEVGLTYTTEVQTDFRKASKWVNLLRLDLSCRLDKKIRFCFSSISIAETCEESLLNDWQGFSNIEERNLPFAPAVQGVEYKGNRSSLFLGVRNVNEDYFISSCASFFTNSSCGIYPTLSANYPLANYPLAALGLDYKLKYKDWTMEVSVYNGTGYQALTGRDNVFRFSPDTDGILGLSSVIYQKNDSEYSMGAGIYRGGCVGNEMGVEEPFVQAAQKKKMTYVLWTYAEQHIYQNIYALLQYSVNPSVEGGCRSYVGTGGIVRGDKVSFGFFLDYADYTTAHEWAGELSCRWGCTSRMAIQPAIHAIRNSSGTYLVGLLRMYYVF